MRAHAIRAVQRMRECGKNNRGNAKERRAVGKIKRSGRKYVELPVEI